MFAAQGQKTLANKGVSGSLPPNRKGSSDADAELANVRPKATRTGHCDSSKRITMSLDEQLQRNIARRRKSESSPYGYGLTSKKIAALQEAGQDPLVQFYASVGCVFRSTSAYLDHLARDVRECKSVNEANNFCRWLFQFRTGRAQEKYASSDIAEIMRKLDVLLSDRAKPVLPAPVSDEVCLTQELQSLGRSANSNNLGALAPDERSEAQAKE